MIIGVNSAVGLVPITGLDAAVAGGSLVRNALDVFQSTGLVKPDADARTAAYAARLFSLSMASSVAARPKQAEALESLQARLQKDGAVVPLELIAAFEACRNRAEPYFVSLYFEALADVLADAAPTVSGATGLARHPVQAAITGCPESVRYRVGVWDVRMEARLETLAGRTIVRHLNFRQKASATKAEEWQVTFSAAGWVSVRHAGAGVSEFTFGTGGEVLESVTSASGKVERVMGEAEVNRARLRDFFPSAANDRRPLLDRLAAADEDISNLTGSIRRIGDWIRIEVNRLATERQTGEGAAARLAANRLTLSEKEGHLSLARDEKSRVEEEIRRFEARRYRLDRETLAERVLSAVRESRLLSVAEIPFRPARV